MSQSEVVITSVDTTNAVKELGSKVRTPSRMIESNGKFSQKGQRHNTNIATSKKRNIAYIPAYILVSNEHNKPCHTRKFQ